MIEHLQNGAQNAVTAINEGHEQNQLAVERAAQAGKSFRTIANAIGTIADMNTQIASAAEQQSAVSEEINRSVVKINDSAQQTKSSQING